MQFSIHSNIYTCFSPHNGTLKKAYSSFLKLHITNQRCILNKKLHSSNSNPGKFQEFNFGRSSDLLHFPNALPIPPKRNSGFEYCRKTFGGAYSSGSVQDLHLIPFSPLFPSNRKSDTKISGDKDTQIETNQKKNPTKIKTN